MILLVLINTLLLVVVYHKLNRKERAKFVHNEQIFCSIILFSMLIYVPIAETLMFIDIITSIITIVDVRENQ